MSAVRVRAVPDLVRIVANEGRTSAVYHGRTAPQAGEVGDRIVTNVPLPTPDAGGIGIEILAAAQNGHDPHVRALAVQSLRWRADGWAAKVSRVVELAGEGRFSDLRRASPWIPGEWNGNALLVAPDAIEPGFFGLPPEADP
jgi:hypothetical protein